MKTQPIYAEAFMQAVTPALAAGDADALAAAALRHAEPMSLCPLLGHRRAEVRRVAAVVLGLVGTRAAVGCLTRSLHDPDDQAAALAEDALWSIWFRGGRSTAMDDFGQGLDHLQAEAYDRAVEAFARSTRLDPDFAEAYNQSAIAHYLAGRWRQSIADTRRALARMPTHFGAMAGLGHCHAHLQQYYVTQRDATAAPWRSTPVSSACPAPSPTFRQSSARSPCSRSSEQPAAPARNRRRLI